MNRTLLIGMLFALGAISCGEESSSPVTTKASLQKAPDGARIFRLYCVQCHGAQGDLQLNGAKDLKLSTLELEERIELITNGRNLMTPFKGLLSKEKIEAVAAYSLKFSEE